MHSVTSVVIYSWQRFTLQVYNNFFEFYVKDKQGLTAMPLIILKRKNRLENSAQNFQVTCTEFSIFWHRTLTTLTISIHLNSFTANLGTPGLDLCLALVRLCFCLLSLGSSESSC